VTHGRSIGSMCRKWKFFNVIITLVPGNAFSDRLRGVRGRSPHHFQLRVRPSRDSLGLVQEETEAEILVKVLFASFIFKVILLFITKITPTYLRIF
jgi:hypothetical protein